MRFLALTLLLLAASALQAADRPNVLFIAIDDQNDWIGCMGGHPQVKTPNIDALAKRGTLFTNAHCQAPLCNPSRSSLLTGLRPSSTGIYGLSPGIRDVEQTKTHITLPQTYTRAGYFTYTCGKIYHDGSLRKKGAPPSNNSDGSKPTPPKKAAKGKQQNQAKAKGDTRDDLTSEFTEWGPAPGIGKRDTPIANLPIPGRHPAMDWGPHPENEADHGDYQIAAAAVGALEKAPKDKPFFIAAGFRLPHVPCFAPQKWFDLYPDATLQMPPVKEDDRADLPKFADFIHWKLPEPRLSTLRAYHEWRPLVRSYLACVSFMDAQLGKVVEALDKSGRAENTIIVLWGDHGWHLGEKLISGKNTLWNESTLVPLIFAGPGVTPGQICKRPAELLDIFPTLLDLTGMPPRADIEGHSLVPQLKDATAPREWPAITTHNQGNHTIRTEKWRYTRYADGTEELYDEEADFNEWTNLAQDPAHAATKKELAKWLPKIDKPPVPGSKNRVLTYDPATGVAVWEDQPIEKKAPLPEP